MCCNHQCSCGFVPVGACVGVARLVRIWQGGGGVPAARPPPAYTNPLDGQTILAAKRKGRYDEVSVS